MKWIEPGGHSKTQVDEVGKTLTDFTNPLKGQELNDSLDVLDNWRAIHAYPLHIFKKRLKNVSLKIDKDAISVQRLKRWTSILDKLMRSYHGKKPTMKLSQMQDIAGCRVVLKNVKKVYELHKRYYYNGDLKHKKVNEKDYIDDPKEDGYRSIHCIYRYNSDKEGKKQYNGLLVEVQIRSKLQHLWASAVETAGFFTRQAFKLSKGNENWREFFRLVSSAFAMREKTTLVPNTPEDKEELYGLIRVKEKELNVVTLMKKWTKATKFFVEGMSKEKDDVFLYLLELDIRREKLTVISYDLGQEKEAIEEYQKAEKRNKGSNEFDVVLVGANRFNDLKKAYPNYFADTKEFLLELEKILKP